jgi:uncharacterized protein
MQKSMALQPSIHAPFRASLFSMLAFQQYQLEFTAHLRDPKANKKPAKVNDARMAVYREIVFNNLFGAVSACYPVCQQCVGKRAWQRLVRGFFADYAASSPFFREIPQHFLAYLNQAQQLPDYLPQLAHYEWVELALASQVTQTPRLSRHCDLLNEIPVLAPAHQLLTYDYPVHHISPRFKPNTHTQTFLLVFRNVHNMVKFIELNPMTYQLLHLIQQNQLTGKQALTQLAAAMQHPDVNAVIGFGEEILNDLVERGAIIGSAT